MDLKYDLVLLLVEQNVARLTGFRRRMDAQMVPESGVLFAGLLKGSIKKKSNPKCSAEDKKKKPQPVTNFRALEEEKQSRHVAVRAAERKALTSGPGNSEDFFRYKEERKTVIAGNVL